jgi:tRNA(Ile)-lysidine synthase
MARLQHQGVVQRYFRFLASLSEPVTTLGIAFSGGPDSCALAVCAAEAVRAGKVGRAVALHVDHGVREESDRDAQAAGAMAEQLGLEFHLSQLELPGRAGENELRVGRYGALADAAEVHDLEAVMTGHHRRDQAETVLLHLLRGAGLEGVAGMSADAALEFGGKRLRIVRPFLNEDPDDLARLAGVAGLNPLIDRTNLETDRTRNRIRHELLPAMEAINAGAELHLAQFAEIAAGEEQLFSAIAQTSLASIADVETLRSDDLIKLPVALQRRTIRLWIARAAEVELSFDRIEAVRSAALSGEGGITIELGDGWAVRHHRRRFTLAQSVDGIREQSVES